MQQPGGLIEAIGNQRHWLYHRRSFVGVIILPVLVLAIWLPGFFAIFGLAYAIYVMRVAPACSD